MGHLPNFFKLCPKKWMEERGGGKKEFTKGITNLHGLAWEKTSCLKLKYDENFGNAQFQS